LKSSKLGKKEPFYPSGLGDKTSPAHSEVINEHESSSRCPQDARASTFAKDKIFGEHHPAPGRRKSGFQVVLVIQSESKAAAFSYLNVLIGGSNLAL